MWEFGLIVGYHRSLRGIQLRLERSRWLEVCDLALSYVYSLESGILIFYNRFFWRYIKRQLKRRQLVIWATSNNGRYSVKLGYQWIQSRSLGLRDHRLSHGWSVPEELWKSIWKLKVPPKIHYFLWSSLHNALAIKATLFKRRSSPSPTCHVCLCQDETIEHILILCPWVESVWFGGALSYKIDRTGISSWVLWLQAIFNSNLGSNANRRWVRSIVAFTC